MLAKGNLFPIINLCLSSHQMTFKRFFWLVRSLNTQKKKNLTWVNMSLGSSLIIPLLFSKDTIILGVERSGLSQAKNS